MTDSPRRIRVGDRVAIYPRGKNKTWCADYWLDGARHRESMKTRNQKVAVRRAVKLDGDLISGKHPSSKSVGTATVRQAAADYLDYLETEGRARKTVVRYRGELNALCDFFESHRAAPPGARYAPSLRQIQSRAEERSQRADVVPRGSGRQTVF